MKNVDLNWDAKFYQKHSPVQYELGLLTLEKLDPGDNEDILEIGCGNGILTMLLAKRVPYGKVIALEFSKEMTQQAEKNLKDHRISNVKVVNTDALKMNYENQFDAVFSNSAIHWIRKQELIYELIHKSLKKNGRIMIQTGLKQISAYSQALINVSIEFKDHLKDFKPPWRFLTKKETEKILFEAKFKEISVEVHPYTVEFENDTDLINYFKAAGFVPFAAVLPKSLHDKFIQRYKRLLFKINQPNPLQLKLDRLFISAKK